jgi:heme/copper-type cytochrome/quinol oxidase subunit 3
VSAAGRTRTEQAAVGRPRAEPGGDGFGATRPGDLPAYPYHVTGGRSPGLWGMVLLIFTEATFFAILLISYFYLRFRSGVTWPPDGIEKPELSLVAIMTPILLLSSGPAHLALAAIRRGRPGRMRLALLLTMAQGGTFIGLQCIEYLRGIEKFTPQTDAYGSLFYTITGFHGVHVFVGLLLLGWLLVNSFRGRWTAENHVAVENVVLYWHFVDVVWVFIFMSLYISPHWWP